MMENIRGSRFAAAKYLLAGFLGTLTSTQALADLVQLDTNAGFASVYLLENPDASVITVSLTVLAGEVDVAELPGGKEAEGLSHYLEHLMYWHADNIDSRPVHARGGNAFVNGILTSYYNEGEQSELDDMLEFVTRLFSPPDLKADFMLRERSVVAREYDLRVSENPDRRVYTDIRRDLYNNLPVSRSVMGTSETINALTFEQAEQFHERFYHPANSVLFISGNVKKDEIQSLVNTRFGNVEPGNFHAASWRDAQIDKESDTTKVFIERQAKYERLVYLSLSEWPDTQNPDSHISEELWYTKKLLAASLDSNLEGGIARPLRTEDFVLRFFEFNLDSNLKGFVELSMFTEPDKDISLEQARDAIADTLTDIATTGIPEATLERVRKRMLQSENRKIDDVNENYSRIVSQINAGISPVNSQQHLENIKNVTLNDVNKLLEKIANPQRRSVAFIKPAGE